ncbi:hypothetical protein G6N76_09170 [Rhizobium daejeonense]|uniref:Uncharacterized protein n=1 Tax=Rhizobium daejeonense TaxID=240521 RepID=A0A6M1RY96_9HYPH|nr:hypothetical protein [Rhizobium daejeonense]NGO63845.1 hypothetical protein [Rhizobium daejeonense]
MTEIKLPALGDVINGELSAADGGNRVAKAVYHPYLEERHIRQGRHDKP